MELDNESGFTAVTGNVRVTAFPEPLEQNSDPDNRVFAFAYTIDIENIGEKSVQLIERHWLVKSSGLQIAEVVGEGVVGLQPTIKPGESFQYSSGSVIHDPVGSMEGEYTFKFEDGTFFMVQIPRFDLIYPLGIH